MRFVLPFFALLPLAAAGTNLWRGFYCANRVPAEHATVKNVPATKGACEFMRKAGVHVPWAPLMGTNGYCWQNGPNDWIKGASFTGLCPLSGANVGHGLEEKK
ncbi:hypothetical protein EJ03DRAFT_327996 [Teratosphaeria nubilosa]|uniref:Uncharacterized protein n=1 Tax=Teratosphaeria nubilosa TaxID=161662 RepID=A0A6G1L7Z5_9PEZI|nr:hypothetical protein EJ03DRAFT_327996 [Teratosphaeria nubilosa]